MKTRYAIVVALVLMIFAVGIVSAEENATDTLTVAEDTDDVSVVDVSAGEDDEVLADDGEEDHISFEKRAYVDVDESTIVSVYEDTGYLDGNISIVIDDADTYKWSYKAKDKENVLIFDVCHLHKVPSIGLHNVNVTYQKNGVDVPFNKVVDFDFTYSFYVSVYGSSSDVDEDYDFIFYEDAELRVGLPKDAKGKMCVNLNGNNFTSDFKGGSKTFKIAKKYLKVGNNTVSCTFLSSTKKYPTKTIKTDFWVSPILLYNNRAAVGEDDTLDIISSKGTKIDVELIDYSATKSLANYSFDGDRNFIPLKKFLNKGQNTFWLIITIGNGTSYKWADIKAYDNSKGFKASVSSVANMVTVKMTGPKLKSNVKIYADHKLVKSVSLKKGKITYKVSKLGLGKHHIKVWFNNGKKYFSKTFTVNVKYYVTLKAVKVKKSAKKLVLTATVKTTKKVKKGLKVTFKFNGKKYKAKTNAKGVAKVTVKKKVLKKLKVGKKVKYQVTYLKHTVKKTAKVKR